jgi:cytochrome P450 family 144
MMKSLAQFDPFDPEVIENPYEFFAALRREAPLYELPNKAYYLISRHEDVKRAVTDVETFSSNLVAILMADQSDGSPQLLNMAGTTAGGSDAPADALAIADPPAHTRQRRVSNRAFSMRNVASMEQDIRNLVNQLLDPVLARGICEWVRDFAIPLPMTMIVRLLGLPMEDLPKLKRWSDCAIGVLSGLRSAEEVVGNGVELTKMVEYIAVQLDLGKQNPGEGVISDLVRASETDSESLSNGELISIVAQLITAGNETTTSLIGTAVKRMLQTQGMQQVLREHPERIPAFIEETLRLDTPLKGHFRLVNKDTEVAGRPLPSGSRVMLLWASANRDDREYPAADQFDLDRFSKPNLHFSFGYGIHHCLGAALGRAETRIALETLLARTKHIELGPDNDFRHVPSLLVRSLRKLDLHIE